MLENVEVKIEQLLYFTTNFPTMLQPNISKGIRKVIQLELAMKQKHKQV